jgi:hypothetical protein
MKRTIATLIAGLFATAAFAQTPAPAPTSSTDEGMKPAKHAKGGHKKAKAAPKDAAADAPMADSPTTK